MTDEVVVRVEAISVSYGRSQILNGISFEVVRGSVYALLGRNGAGKSSLMRCLLGLQKPTSGRATVFGDDVWRHRARLLARVAYVPENADAPGQLSVRDVARFHSSLYPAWDQAAVSARLDRFGIAPSTTVGALSKGQRALFTLALALCSKPDLLVLDDPTLGLDVVARNDFFSDFIGELADRGTTVILTTHDLAGVEGIADRVGILQGSRLAVDQTVEGLRSERGESLETIFTEITRTTGRAS